MSRYYLLCFVTRILLRLLFRIHVEGVGNIPRVGPFLIAPNHNSFLDPVVTGAFIPRDVCYMARDTLFDIPFLGWLVRVCHSFPVRRDRPYPQTMKRALKVLKEGKGLVLFPEGTRSITGKLQRGGPGVGMLASHTGAPVVPTAIAGTEKALPINAHWIRLEKVRVHFGRPIYPSQVEVGKDRRRLYQELTDEVMERIKDLQMNL